MDPIAEALDLYEAGNVNEAVNHIMEHANEISEQDQFSVAELLQQWGFLDEARRLFEELHRTYPGDHQIKFQLADIYIDLEMDEVALELVESIEPDDPEYINALMILADIYQSQGLNEVAEQKLMQAKELQPDNYLIDFGIAELAFHNGEFQKAVEHYEKIESHSGEFPFVNIHERLAESYSSIGKWEEALSYYEELELKEPDPLFKYGYTAYQLKRYDIAIKVWNDLLDLDPDYTSVYPYLAKAYEEEGIMDAASDVLKKGLKKDEHNIELYITIAKNELKQDHIEEAKRYLKEAIALDPGHEKAIVELYNIYETHGDWEDARKLIEELKKFEPYPEILDWKAGQVYNELEEYDLAKEAYTKAHTTFHQEADFLREYGYFLVEEGQIEQAISLLEKYLAQNPEDRETAEFINRMKGE
ncbi:tetratricopeptide repeat protein [Aquisalibacillus elongatus]|uniref:Tetratricopeptide repeat protein n=1 Tax=Aquisalibacillus elongatus TaxID=485577 RepID=A0A3N5BE94_9BACI|nr:tetratricopeptide repeat protein [Aquisalibacillus elongatus]RPF55773.1 tetratricopeptide repeat protein [Aquisalibacillus elongatus]